MKLDDDHAVRATMVAGRAWIGAGVVLLIVAIAVPLIRHDGPGLLQGAGPAALLVVFAGLIAVGYRRASDRAAVRPLNHGSNLLRLSRIPFWQQDWSLIRRRLASMSPRSNFGPSDGAEIGELAATVRTIAVNGAAIGFTERVLPNDGASRYFHPFDDDIAVAAVRAYLNGEDGFETETELATVSGEPVCVVVSFDFPHAATGSANVLMSAFDVSPYRAVDPGGSDRHLQRTTIAPDAMGILTTAIVDELCEHLTTVQVSAESTVRWLGRTDPDLAEVRRSIRDVLLANDRSAVVIRLARDMLRKSGSSLESISLGALIGETTLLMANELSVAGIDHALVIEDDLPDITADRASIQQLLIQLLAVAIDALKSEKSGGRRLTILANRHQEDEVIVAIEDTAGGVGTERTDAAGMSTMGLASVESRRLAACRETVTAHGGKLRIVRRPGLGSVISFTFPANGADPIDVVLQDPLDTVEYTTARQTIAPFRPATHTNRY